MIYGRSGYQSSEFGAFPDDWHSVTLASTASSAQNAIVGGPFGSNLVSADYTDIGVPVIRGQNMGGKFVGGEFAFVSPTKAKSLTANCASASDLIFTQRGTLGQVSMVPSGAFDRYVVSQSQMKLTVDKARFDPEYLYYYFSSPTGQRQITDSAIQTGVPHTNLGILRQYRLPVPPTLQEQQVIAETLRDADELIASLDGLIAKKRDIKQGAMQQLLTGKRRLPGFSAKWETMPLSAIATFSKGFGLSKAAITETGRYKCIHYGELFTGYSATIGEVRSRTNFSDFRRVSSLNDVLMPTSDVTPTGLATASCVVEAGVILGGDILIISGNSRLWGPYLSHVIRWDRPQIMALVSGTTVFHIYSTDMGRFRIALPEFKEQQAIAATLDQMDSEVVDLEKKSAKWAMVRQGMMQQLLTGQIRLA